MSKYIKYYNSVQDSLSDWTNEQNLLVYLNPTKETQEIEAVNNQSSSSTLMTQEWVETAINNTRNSTGYLPRRYTLYDSNGIAIPYDDTKNYRVVRIDDRNPTACTSFGIAYDTDTSNYAFGFAWNIINYNGILTLRPYFVGYMGYANPWKRDLTSLTLLI